MYPTDNIANYPVQQNDGTASARWQESSNFQGEELPVSISSYPSYSDFEKDWVSIGVDAPENSVLKQIANGISKTLTGFKGSKIAKGIKKTLKRDKNLSVPLAGAIIGGRLALFPIGSVFVIAGRAAGLAAGISIAIAGGALYFAYGSLKIASRAAIEILKLPFKIIKMIIDILVNGGKFLFKLITNPTEAKEQFSKAGESIKDGAKKTVQSIKEFSPRNTLKKISESKAFEKYIDAMEKVMAAGIIGGMAIGGAISGIGMNIVNFTLDIGMDKEELSEENISQATTAAALGASSVVVILTAGSIIYGQKAENESSETA